MLKKVLKPVLLIIFLLERVIPHCGNTVDKIMA